MVNIWSRPNPLTNLVSLTSPMIQYILSPKVISLLVLEKIFKWFLTIYGRGSHLGYATRIINFWTNCRSPILKSLHFEFEINWRSGLRKEDVWKCWQDWWTSDNILLTLESLVGYTLAYNKPTAQMSLNMFETFVPTTGFNGEWIDKIFASTLVYVTFHLIWYATWPYSEKVDIWP